MASVHPTNPTQTSPNDLPGVDKYWQWSLPSIALAWITIALWGLSELVVQPRLSQRYSAMVTADEERLSKSRSDLERDLASEIKTASAESSPATVARLEGYLELAHRNVLASKRLAIMEPLEPARHVQHAKAALAHAYGSLLMARYVGKSPSQSEQHSVEKWQSEHQRSLEDGILGMQLASRLQGDAAGESQRWLMAHALDHEYPSARFPGRFLLELTDTMPQVQGDASAEAQRLLGRLTLCQALATGSPSLARDERIQLAGRALSLLENQLATAKFTDRVWYVEALALFDKQQAGEEARRLVVEALQTTSSWDADVVPTTEAIVRLMLLRTGVEEALTYASSRLRELLPSQQIVLRRQIAAALLRFSVASLLQPDSLQSTVDAQKILAGVVQFAPDAPWFLELAHEMVLQSPGTDSISAELMERLNSGEELAALTAWLRTALKQEPDGDLPSLPELGPQWMVGFVPYLIERSRDSASNAALVIRMMDAFLDKFPEEIELRMARASVSLQLDQWEKAKMDLEWLHERLPNNKNIEQLLERLEKR